MLFRAETDITLLDNLRYGERISGSKISIHISSRGMSRAIRAK